MDDFAIFRLAELSEWAPTLMLVIFRVAGIFLVAPLLNNSALPMVVKAMLAVVIALAVTGRMAAPVALPVGWPAVILAIGSEAMIGAVLGYTANLVFVGIETAGQHMGQQMGIALANIYNPQTQATSNVTATMINLFALAAFVLLGGHRLILAALLETFGSIPLMGFAVSADVLDMVVSLLTAAFILGFKLAAPVLIVLMLASVAMGLIQRTMPQFNILSAGFQIRIMVALIVLFVTLSAMVPLMRQMWAIIERALAPIF